MLESILWLCISVGLLYMAWSEHRHAMEIARLTAAWADAEARAAAPAAEPFPLIVPARAGWGTRMDLAMTQVAPTTCECGAEVAQWASHRCPLSAGGWHAPGRLPAFTLLEFSAAPTRRP